MNFGQRYVNEQLVSLLLLHFLNYFTFLYYMATCKGFFFPSQFYCFIYKVGFKKRCLHQMTKIKTSNLNLSQTNPCFLRVCRTSLLKTLWGMEKLLVTCNFSISHSVLYPFGECSIIFIKFKIVVCKLSQFGRVYNSSFGNELRALAVSILYVALLVNFVCISEQNIPKEGRSVAY